MSKKSEIDDMIFNSLFKGYSNKKKVVKEIKSTFNKTFVPIIKMSQIKKTLPYEYCKDSKSFGLHIGQRKLLLGEVQFLTYNKQPYCIYPGAAPGHKTHFLSLLFPDIKFILIDPNIFEIVLTNKNISFRKEKHPDIVMLYNHYPTQSNTYDKNKNIEEMNDKEVDKLIEFINNTNYKIYIIENYMTQKLSEILKKLGKCSFIEDIRSNVTLKAPVDFDIVWNRSMVHNWISVLKPEVSMVKFRIPYFNAKENLNDYPFSKDDFELSKSFGVDFVADYDNGEFKMSKSELYLQTWGGENTSEMRGWIYKKNINKIIAYKLKTIEGKLFYYNKVLRVTYHTNPYTIKSLHLCNCNDCCIETKIWMEYIDVTKSKNTLSYFIKLADTLTSRPLKNKHNNVIYEPLTQDYFIKLVNNKNNSTEYKGQERRGNKGQ